MDKRLKNNITSAYWEAAQHLYPQHTKRKVIAYVESYEDVAFWRSLLGTLENEKRQFQIMLPNANALSKGKKMALLSALKNTSFGTNMIACVDSDYDYLMQHSSPFSHKMNSETYIFQTYTYAIENYHCYADTLHEVCVQATLNDRVLVDFPLFFRQYSKVIYPLFIWNIYFYRHRKEYEFSLTDFNNCTGLSDVDIDRLPLAIDYVKRNVEYKLNYLSRNYPRYESELPNLSKELEALGVQPENTYLFIQGHHLMDNVVTKLLFPVCVRLRREREHEIKRLARNEEQFNNELQCYHNSICSLEMALHRNMNFHDVFLYKKLIDKLNRSL